MLESVIPERMKTPFVGALAFLTGGTISVQQMITSGSLWLTAGGSLLAFAGGIWTWKTSRLKYQIESVKLKQAELEFERINRHSFGVGSRHKRAR